MAKKSNSTNARVKEPNTRSMNEDLKQWLTEKDKENLSKKIKTHKKVKKPHGMCQVCGTKTASEVCIKCGRSVCSSCYFNLVGLCEKCLTKETAEKWKNKRPDWEKILGVDCVD